MKLISRQEAKEYLERHSSLAPSFSFPTKVTLKGEVTDKTGLSWTFLGVYDSEKHYAHYETLAVSPALRWAAGDYAYLAGSSLHLVWYGTLKKKEIRKFPSVAESAAVWKTYDDSSAKINFYSSALPQLLEALGHGNTLSVDAGEGIRFLLGGPFKENYSLNERGDLHFRLSGVKGHYLEVSYLDGHFVALKGQGTLLSVPSGALDPIEGVVSVEHRYEEAVLDYPKSGK